LAMVYAIGPISGCHINPAITLAMLAAGKIKVRDAVAYVISQVIGAVIGAGILYGIASGLNGYSLTENGLGQNFYGDKEAAISGLTTTVYGYTWAAAFLAEVVLTFLFLMVIFGSTSEKAPKGFAGIAIGISLVFIHLVGIPITGTSVNPARSIGPAIFVGGDALEHLWLFIVAPIIGGLIAALVWKFLFEEKAQEAVEIEEPRSRRHYEHRRPAGRSRY
ncbi:MAG: aquaporin, partial [Thermoplasmatota archaeon]